jgi:hypothetical protein
VTAVTSPEFEFPLPPPHPKRNVTSNADNKRHRVLFFMMYLLRLPHSLGSLVKLLILRVSFIGVFRNYAIAPFHPKKKDALHPTQSVPHFLDKMVSIVDNKHDP